MSSEQKPHAVRDKTYVLVWLGLIILTGITVSVTGMNMGRVGVLVALLIAGFKSGLVFAYFMHLKYEKDLLLFKFMVPGTILLLVLFIGVTFFDVIFR